MNKVSKKNIEIFGKVLMYIGETIEKNPKEFQTLINKLDKEENRKNTPVRKQEIQQMNVYKLVKEKNRNDVFNELMEYKTEELRYIIKEYSLESTRLRKKEKLCYFIIDQIEAKQIDVFLNHKRVED